MNEQYILRELKRLKHRICCLAQGGGSGDPEIFVSGEPLSGPAGAGYTFGIDTTNQTIYFVNVLS